MELQKDVQRYGLAGNLSKDFLDSGFMDVQKQVKCAGPSNNISPNNGGRFWIW